MFLTNLDSIFVIPLLPVLHGGTAAAVARDIAFALSLRLGASLVLSLILQPWCRAPATRRCCSPPR
jgi:hypothetical protein